MGEGNFSPGEEIVLFEMPLKRVHVADNTSYVANDSSNDSRNDKAVSFATVICFESIFPDLVRRFVKNGAKFLVVITNDAWFGRDYFPWWLNAGLFQHAQMSVFRAVENRISIARCANTGVSMFINPFGRIQSTSSIFKEEFLVSNIPLRREITFFTKYGNVFTRIVSFIGLILLPTTLFLKKGLPKLNTRKQIR